jgi:hypothetical protein
VAIQYLPSSSQAPQQHDRVGGRSGSTSDDAAESNAPRASDFAEGLARLAITYLTALAAMLSLVGGAWALGVLGL